jgi:hypothetical protein
MSKKCLSIAICCLIFQNVLIKAQQNILRPEFFSSQLLSFALNINNANVHTAFKPCIFEISDKSTSDNYTDTLSLPDSIKSKSPQRSWFYRKLFTENFIQLNTENFRLKINPLFNLELKKDDDGTKNLYTNTRGIELMGDLDHKIFFYSSFYENQARFEPYINEYISKYLVVPGQGAPKFKPDNKLDYSMVSGWLFFKIGKNIGISTGYSKHFIGEGYRSLILSDNSFDYPFLRFSATFGKFQYSILWSQHQLFEKVYYDYHFRKYNALTQFSWKPNSFLELSLFESVEWPGDVPGKKNFSINFFNPVMFWRTAQFGLNNEKNVLLGLNSKVKLSKYAQLYGQFALDNLDSKNKANNNFAFQLGIKHFDLFYQNLSKQKLFIQLEYNYIAPYTYTNQNSLQSFTHYNQPLAHPAGTGLKESLAIIEYCYKDFSLRIIASHLINSMDTLNSNFGSDIFMPNEIVPGIVSHTGNKPGQGVKNTIDKINTQLIYIVNPSYNFQIFAQMVYRQMQNELQDRKDLIFSVGIRTNINNYYYDF